MKEKPNSKLTVKPKRCWDAMQASREAWDNRWGERLPVRQHVQPTQVVARAETVRQN